MKDYKGKVKPGGSQFVQAPFKTTAAKGGKVKTGEDLRTGKKGK